jgi:hypothetical protein
MQQKKYRQIWRPMVWVTVLAMVAGPAVPASAAQAPATQTPAAQTPAAPAVTPAVQAVQAKLPPNAHMGIVQFQDQPIPGATVTAVQGDKKLVTSTDDVGVYRFNEMTPGTWSVTVSMVGFADTTIEITIPSDAPPPTLAIALLPFDEIAKGIEIVKVAPQTASAAPAATNGNRQPAPGTGAQGGQGFQRAGVTQTAPPPSAQANAPRRPDPPPDPFGGATDGLVVNGSVNNGAATPFAQLANFGNNRRGGRSLYNYQLGFVAGNSAWDAQSYGTTRQPSYNDLQINGGFGGPLRLPFVRNDRDPQIQLQFSRTADTNANTQNSRVPTAAQRTGDFSGVTDAFGRPVQLVDPLTGQPFANNQIPADRISPQAAALLGFYPEPNAAEGIFNYQRPIVNSVRAENLQMQLNQPINNRTSANGRLAVQRSNTDSNNLLGFQNHNRSTGLDTMINIQRRIGQLFTLRTRYQFIWQKARMTPFFANRTNVSGDAGITGNNQDPINWGPPNLAFSISSTAGLFDANASSSDTRTHAPGVEMFWNRGRHSVQFGGDARFINFDVVRQENPRGTFTFSGYATGYDFADFLLGMPRTSSLAFGNADKQFRGMTIAGFVTDDIRVGPSFTVQAGVRYEYEAPITDAAGRLVNLDVAPGFTAVAPVLASNPVGSLTGLEYGKGLVRADRLGFQPRTAIAWRPVPGSSLVVRAGYGIYRNTNVYQQLANLMAQQPPLSRAFNVETSATTPLTLANGFTNVPTTALNTFAIDPNFRPGFAQNWQASVQRDLPMSLTVVGTYLGVKGHRLMQEFLPNTYAPGAVNPCASCPVGFVYLTSTGKSTRHSGQVQLRRRLRNGLTAQIQYTLARAEDDATAFIGASTSGNVIAQDWRNLDAEWGPSNFDQRHNITAGFQYTTGVGVAGGTLVDGWRGALLKNWTVTSQITSGSGMPFTPVYNVAVPGTGTIGSVRAQLTGQPVDAEGYYVNPAAFTVPASGTWGNAGRNSVRGPAQFNMDAGLTRTFLMGDRLQVDWRIDGRNILNRVTFSNINTFVGNPQFGLATFANQMRKLTTTIRLRF